MNKEICDDFVRGIVNLESGPRWESSGVPGTYPDTGVLRGVRESRSQPTDCRLGRNSLPDSRAIVV